MSSSTGAVPTVATPTRAVRSGTHRRALVVTAGITVAAFALLVDLLLAGHTVGEEIWGPITAMAGTAVGLLSLLYLAMGARSRMARVVLYGLWVMVAFFGVGGYNDHRLPRSADTITDRRERPPLAPLAFTGLAIGGAIALRSGSKVE